MTDQNTLNDFTQRAKAGVEGFMVGQNELIQEMNTFSKHWIDSVQAQIETTAQLMNQLTSARTLPDVVSACQDSASKRGAMIADDGKLLMTDYQRCMAAAAKCLFTGYKPTASS